MSNLFFSDAAIVEYMDDKHVWNVASIATAFRLGCGVAVLCGAAVSFNHYKSNSETTVVKLLAQTAVAGAVGYSAGQLTWLARRVITPGLVAGLCGAPIGAALAAVSGTRLTVRLPRLDMP